MSRPTLSRTAAQTGAPQWRYLLGRLHLTVRFPTFAAALAFVQHVGDLATEQDHHPEIDLRYTRVHLAMSSHDAGGITARDLRLADAVSHVVGQYGGTPEPWRLTQVEVAIDTMDAERIRPFWRAVLGYTDDDTDDDDGDGDDALTDPDRVGPGVWFQQLDQPRPVRNRIHLDVTVAHDHAEARIAAALAVGGTLVSADAAPRFWILADADGNEACVCTWQGRDQLEAGERTPTSERGRE